MENINNLLKLSSVLFVVHPSPLSVASNWFQDLCWNIGILLLAGLPALASTL